MSLGNIGVLRGVKYEVTSVKYELTSIDEYAAGSPCRAPGRRAHEIVFPEAAEVLNKTYHKKCLEWTFFCPRPPGAFRRLFGEEVVCLPWSQQIDGYPRGSLISVASRGASGSMDILEVL